MILRDKIRWTQRNKIGFGNMRWLVILTRAISVEWWGQKKDWHGLKNEREVREWLQLGWQTFLRCFAVIRSRKMRQYIENDVELREFCIMQICMLIGIIYSKQGSKKIALHNNSSLIWLLQFGSCYRIKGKAKLLEVLQDTKQSGNSKLRTLVSTCTSLLLLMSRDMYTGSESKTHW